MPAGVSSTWIPPRPTAKILHVDPVLVPEYMAWFVNRKAYTRQSDNPNPDNGRYYYFHPKERVDPKAPDVGWQQRAETSQRDPDHWAVRHQPETQCSKWVAIDADYSRHRDLAALKLELK
jgi:hypothetical protein